MRLAALLFALGLKLRISALISAAFRKRLRHKDFVIVIRTAEPGPARTFCIRRGRIRSRPGRDPSADTELVWEDAQTALRTMLSSNELDSFSAIGRARLRILGDLDNALRFMDLAR
jgi:hypothetical protein